VDQVRELHGSYDLAVGGQSLKMSSRPTKALARSCKLACCFEAIAFTSGLKLRRLPSSSVILALRGWLSPRKCSVMAASLGPRLAAKKPRAQKEPTRGLTSALGRGWIRRPSWS
jgi:hypothetical protein